MWLLLKFSVSVIQELRENTEKMMLWPLLRWSLNCTGTSWTLFQISSFLTVQNTCSDSFHQLQDPHTQSEVSEEKADLWKPKYRISLRNYIQSSYLFSLCLFFLSLPSGCTIQHAHLQIPQASHLYKQLYLVFYIFTYVAKQFDTLCVFPTMCGQEMVFAAFIKTFLWACYEKD